jgi:nucleoside-diphosphate-sugar epimerase
LSRDALIGHTGFVGQILLRHRGFSVQFNSANVTDSAGKTFDLVVCAAAPGSMFEANRFPERDALAIDALCQSLGKIRARQFVLVSTIAVLAQFDGQADESTEAFQTALAYGSNRRRLEVFCAQQFEECLILRLPALFGEGLKKNFLFDLMNPVPSMLPLPRFDAFAAALGRAAAAFYRHDPALGMMVLDRAALDVSADRSRLDAEVTAAGFSAVGFTHPKSRFQFYQMSHLAADMQTGLAAGLSVLHLAPEPVAAGEVYRAVTGHDMADSLARVHSEDMRTRNADLWGRSGPYISEAGEVLAALRDFIPK